jgi:hypothetical protein
MSTVLWVLGVWLLVSVPFGILFGSICRSNGSDREALPLTPAPADHETFGVVRRAA